MGCYNFPFCKSLFKHLNFAELIDLVSPFAGGGISVGYIEPAVPHLLAPLKMSKYPFQAVGLT